MEIKGLENAIKLRMIYVDTKETVIVRSITQAGRLLRVSDDTIKRAMNPLNKKRFEYNGRTVVIRSYREPLSSPNT